MHRTLYSQNKRPNQWILCIACFWWMNVSFCVCVLLFFALVLWRQACVLFSLAPQFSFIVIYAYSSHSIRNLGKIYAFLAAFSVNQWRDTLVAIVYVCDIGWEAREKRTNIQRERSKRRRKKELDIPRSGGGCFHPLTVSNAIFFLANIFVSCRSMGCFVKIIRKHQKSIICPHFLAKIMFHWQQIDAQFLNSPQKNNCVCVCV